MRWGVVIVASIGLVFGLQSFFIVIVSIQGMTLGLKNGPSNDSQLLGLSLEMLLREFN